MRHLITIMMAALLTACGHRVSQQGEAAGADSTQVVQTPGFAVDSIAHGEEDSLVSVTIAVDWPSDGDDSLVDSISRYICEEMADDLTQEDSPKVQYFTDGKKAVNSTYRQKYQHLKKMREELMADNDGIIADMTFSFYLRIKMVDEGERYITYLTNSEGFLGGAHGFATSTGATFRKSDGKRIGYLTRYNKEKEQFEIVAQTLFKDIHSKELNELLKEGIKRYFQEFQETPISDDDLKDQLMDIYDLSNIPLPNNAPVFTKDGLSFTYQQYEIAAYAAGMPNFNIPYEQISPCLTDDAKHLIP